MIAVPVGVRDRPTLQPVDPARICRQDGICDGRLGIRSVNTAAEISRNFSGVNVSPPTNPSGIPRQPAKRQTATASTAPDKAARRIRARLRAARCMMLIPAFPSASASDSLMNTCIIACHRAKVKVTSGTFFRPVSTRPPVIRSDRAVQNKIGGHRRTAMTSQSAPLSPPAGRARCATDRVQVCHRANGHPARRTEPFRNASCADGEAKTDCCSMLHR